MGNSQPKWTPWPTVNDAKQSYLNRKQTEANKQDEQSTALRKESEQEVDKCLESIKTSRHLGGMLPVPG